MSNHSKPTLVFVAQIGAAHGVQGEFKLLSHTDDPVAVLEYNPLLDERGEPALSITAAREHKGQLLVRAKEVPDRTAADRVKGLKLYVDRSNLPDPDEDEYYITDLIGLSVVDGSGTAIGTVANVENFGAGDLLDIKPVEGANFYLLFTADNVPQVDIAGGRIVVDLSET